MEWTASRNCGRSVPSIYAIGYKRTIVISLHSGIQAPLRIVRNASLRLAKWSRLLLRGCLILHFACYLVVKVKVGYIPLILCLFSFLFWLVAQNFRMDTALFCASSAPDGGFCLHFHPTDILCVLCRLLLPMTLFPRLVVLWK